MMRRLTLLVSVTAVALLVLSSAAEGAPRHQRLGHRPERRELPPEVKRAVAEMFRNCKQHRVTGFWLEDKGTELEVQVSFPDWRPIEVVFKKVDRPRLHWRLAGFEYPAPKESLTPPAYCALEGKYPGARLGEVELVFDRAWKLLGYQVTIGGHEVFVTASGNFIPDPL